MSSGGALYNKFQEDDRKPVVHPEDVKETSYHRKSLTPFQAAKKKRNTRRKWISTLVGVGVAIVLISLIAALSVHHITMGQVEKAIVEKEWELFNKIDRIMAGEVDSQVANAVKSLVMNNGYNNCANETTHYKDTSRSTLLERCYVVKDVLTTRKEAQAECAKEGGFLATHITRDFRSSLMPLGNTGGWIGLKKRGDITDPKKGWEWELPTGNVAVDMNSILWEEGVSGAHDKGRDIDDHCGYVYQYWHVLDTSCSGFRYPICEYAETNNIAAAFA